MKQLFLLALLTAGIAGFSQTSVTPASATTTFSQVKLPAVDKSPMDMAYYPVNYPVLKIQDKATEPLVARVIYSRPQKEGRAIFGGLIEYGKVWRLGANEATEIELYRDVKIKDKKLSKGRYTIYAIPTTTQWTIIFNKDTDIWGAFKYDESKDALRIDVPVQKNAAAAEAFSIQFSKSATGADMMMAWDDAMVTLPVSFK
ncbi:MAG: hypothetical protein JWR72_2871 [Flavisolibacter sp.]|jgi:hypothetical protein|nr:hypothetical protein [Flavisolibacter sp.]